MKINYFAVTMEWINSIINKNAECEKPAENVSLRMYPTSGYSSQDSLDKMTVYWKPEEFNLQLIKTCAKII